MAMNMRVASLALLALVVAQLSLVAFAQPISCPAGQGLFHINRLVKVSDDDVEEFEAGGGCHEGHLYRVRALSPADSAVPHT